jgi:membrane-bound lytic murein transglycosylase B
VAVRIAAVLAVSLLALTGCAGGAGRAEADRCPDLPDPPALACRLVVADAVAHDSHASAEQRADAGADAEEAYQALAESPVTAAEPVFAALAPALAAQARRAVDAARALDKLAGPPSPTLPAWRVVEPLPVATLRDYYAEAQRHFGVDWTVLAAIHLVETHLGRVIGTSTAGAQGPMQFMAATWARYGLGGDVRNNRDAILGAANYLAANGAADPARLDHAIFRYNNDVRYVRAVRDYAAMLAADPAAFRALHAWPARYRTVAGEIALPTGYAADHPIPVGQWLAAHPTPGDERTPR